MVNRLLWNGDIPDDYYHAAIFKHRLVAMDIETTGLDKTRDRIALVQIHVPSKGTVLIRDIKQYPTNLIGLLENRNVTKVFHHAPFDITFLTRDLHLAANNISCTKVAAKILDPNKAMYQSHSLKFLLKAHFGIDKNKDLAVSNWLSEELTDAQIEYAAIDVEYLIDLLYVLEVQLLNRGKLKLARDAYKHIPTHVKLEMMNYKDVYGY